MLQQIATKLPDGRIEYRMGNATWTSEDRDKLWVTLVFPTLLLQDLRDEASRLDGSPSGLLGSAWRRMGNRLAEPESTWANEVAAVRARYRGTFDADGTPQRYILDAEDWREVLAIATRLDREPGWVLSQAWFLARPHYAAQPGVNVTLGESAYPVTSDVR